jgi:hypothetical protein
LPFHELRQPLSQLNGTLATEADIEKLINSLNDNLGSKSLSDEQLKKAFRKWWSEFDQPFQVLLKKSNQPAAPSRTIEDMTEEILELVRNLHGRKVAPYVYSGSFNAPLPGDKPIAIDMPANVRVMNSWIDQSGTLRFGPVEWFLDQESSEQPRVFPDPPDSAPEKPSS